MPFLIAAAVLFIRLTVFFIRDGYVLSGHVQSLLLAVMLAIVGFLVLMFGLLADRIGDTRRLMEEVLYRLRRDELARLAQESGKAAPREESDEPT